MFGVSHKVRHENEMISGLCVRNERRRTTHWHRKSIHQRVACCRNRQRSLVAVASVQCHPNPSSTRLHPMSFDSSAQSGENEHVGCWSVGAPFHPPQSSNNADALTGVVHRLVRWLSEVVVVLRSVCPLSQTVFTWVCATHSY